MTNTLKNRFQDLIGKNVNIFTSPSILIIYPGSSYILDAITEDECLILKAIDNTGHPIKPETISYIPICHIEELKISY